METKILKRDEDEQDFIGMDNAAGEHAPRKSMRERAIEDMEREYDEMIIKLEAENLVKRRDLEQQSEGRQSEIEEFEQRDLARAEMEAQLARKDEELSASKFSLDSISRNLKNAITRRKRLMNNQESQKKRKGILENDITTCIEAIELITEKLNLLNEEAPENLAEIQKVEEQKAEKENDLEKRNQELAAVCAKIQENDRILLDINNEIRNYGEEQERVKTECERLKTERDEQRSELEITLRRDRGEEPEWYQDYLKAKSSYDKSASELAAAEEGRANAREQIDSMVQVQIEGEDGSVSEALYDASGEGRGYAENESAQKQLDVIREEVKVENQLKNSEALKEVNQNTIPTFLNYNPETGNEYQQEEEVQDSNLLANDINKLMTDENIASIKKLATSLKGNSIINGIDSLLTKTGKFEEPLKKILEKIENADFQAMRAYVLDLINRYASPEFRSESPLAYEIASMIFSTLGDLLNLGDKGDLSAGSGIDAAIGDFGNAHLGEIAGKVLSTISGMLNWKDILAFAGKQAIKLAAKGNRVSGAASHIADSGKSFIGIFENVSNGIALGSEEEIMRKQGNEKYARIISGAKSAAYSQSVQNITNTASGLTKGFVKVSLGGTAGGVINLGIGIAATAINKIIGWGFKKSDKNSVLNSPQVLGGVNYDKKLVKEEKFNEILKRVSGITSKDKVYGAIKTVDAISLHAAMKKSYANADHTADRVLADLGFANRDKYPEVSVYDIMKKSGHEPKGGDWRQELKDALLVEGEDYKTLGNAVMDKVKSGAKKGWNYVKSTVSTGISWIGQKLRGFFDIRENRRGQYAVMA